MGLSSTTLWRRANPEAAKRHRQQEKERWFTNPETRFRHRGRNVAHRAKIKLEVFNYYGRVCRCCGEGDLRFLTLDHIANNGAEERKRLGSRGIGHAFYTYLRIEGFPAGYQVLCWNCNCGKRMNGGICPHKT